MQDGEIEDITPLKSWIDVIISFYYSTGPGHAVIAAIVKHFLAYIY